MEKCDNPRCPSCYPNWKEEEAAAKKRAEDDKQDCINCWRFFQKKAEGIVSADDPIVRNRASMLLTRNCGWTIIGSNGLGSLHLHPNRSAAACSTPQR